MNYGQNISYTKHSKSCPRPLASSDEIGCPVCQISLAHHPSHIRTDAIEGHGHEAAAMRNEIRELNAGKFRDVELVVAAPCGHMFHRFCLRHYCFVYQQANNTDHVECPVCSQDLSMVRFQTIDYKAHLGGPSQFDQHYKETSFMQTELQNRKDAEKQILDSVAQKISDANIKLDAYRNHQRSMTDRVKLLGKALQEQSNLKRHIQKCNEGIDAMHKENLNIIKMYLSIMKDQPEEVLHDKRIPEPLIPYLAVILGDERLVKKFGEILKPVEMNGIRSNTELLIKEILADVGTKSTNSNKMDSTRNTLTKATGKPVVVKVQRSHVSIFSRTVLDKESLQTILYQVKDPINKLHDTHHKLTSINQSGRNKKSVVTTPIGRSASDIQILFEPRKNKMYDPGPISRQESNVNLLKPVPRRRCKSTEPILMKEKGTKTVVVKVNELHKAKELEMGNALRDEKRGACIPQEKPEVNKEFLCNVKLQTISSRPPSTKSCQTSFYENAEEEKIQERRIPSKDIQPERFTNWSRAGESCKVFQFQEEKDNGRNSTAGFTPNASGSVFEMIYENDRVDVDADSDCGYNPLTSLVDDVSKITFGTFKRVIPCQVPGVDGNVNQPLMEYSVLLPKKVSTSTNTDVNFNKNETQPSEGLKSCAEQQPQCDADEDDIENAYRESESPQNSGRCKDRQNTGFLQGILPGPYLSPAKGRGQPAVSYLTEKVPVYQSKWLTKLPSARTDYFPHIISTNPRRLERIKAREYDGFQLDGQNQPYGDTGQKSQVPVCMKHTVIDIPSTNSIVTHFPTARDRGYYQRPVNRPMQRPTSPMSMSQRSLYSRNNSFATLENQHRLVQQTSSRYGFNSHQPTNYGTDQCQQHLPTPLKQYQQCPTSGHYNRDRNRNTRSPMSSGDSRLVENAFVEVCQGLSPPRRHRSSRHGMPIHYEYGQNSSTDSVIRRHRDNSSGLSQRQRHQPESAMLICPDGISPRMVRKAKRRQNINV